uniref:Ribosomal protein S4 n=1 Tax=Babesia sp. Dunhuang TaxID=1164853 RepID=A0A411AD38_9APIC|nr:hypothetical protein BXAP_01 [Babesia sp. Xinjiang]QAX26965.1 ribosomal protein S4 [Babesia sp. Xinjiang]QAX26995.1 ribosomal protein S4 [Babesia sp. Dunhuang]
MNIKFNKIKLLKKFNLYTLYGFTNKLNLHYAHNKKYTVHKLIKNIQLLKILYKLKNKRIKDYLEFNIYKLINLLKLLNSRIDHILLESNLFITLNNIRQHIVHRHILLNNKIVINYSYVAKNNDILHILNFNKLYVINTIIYNYIYKNLKTYIIRNKIDKCFNNKQYVKYILLNNNCTIFTKYTCYKTFKVYINSYKTIKNTVDTYMLNK